MFFTYWTGDVSALDAFRRDWVKVDPLIVVYDDLNVTGILAKHSVEWVEIYNRIRIPACKSDVARIALLYEIGGFYVDAHSAPTDTSELGRLLSLASGYELVVFDEVIDHEDENDIAIKNSALIAKPRSEILKFLLTGIFFNLARQLGAETAAGQYVPYNIYVLSGPWEIRTRLFSGQKPFVLKPDFDGRVLRHRLSRDLGRRPLLWYVHYHYRKPGAHWSERQQHEQLFS